jgi:putative membrane protein
MCGAPVEVTLEASITPPKELDMLTTIATAATTVADRWDGDRPDFWPIFPIMWFLIIIGGIVAAVVISRRNRDAAGPRAGEAVLAQRYAAGEIDEEEYAARLAVLRRR